MLECQPFDSVLYVLIRLGVLDSFADCFKGGGKVHPTGSLDGGLNDLLQRLFVF